MGHDLQLNAVQNPTVIHITLSKISPLWEVIETIILPEQFSLALILGPKQVIKISLKLQPAD